MDKKKFKWTDEIECIFCVTVLAAMLFAASYNVLCRYLLNNSQGWPDELCRFGLIWTSFISMSAAVTSGNHLYVDLLTGITEKHKKFALVLRYFASTVWVAIGAFLGYWGWRSVLRVAEQAQALPISMKVVYLAIPVGCAFMIFRVIQSLVRDTKKIFAGNKLDTSGENGSEENGGEEK